MILCMEFFQRCLKKSNLGEAELIHGHQWQWGGEPWSLLEADVSKRLTFYGHSHRSGLLRNGQMKGPSLFDHPYDVKDGQTLVNVGAVVSDQEWVLYDDMHRHCYIHESEIRADTFPVGSLSLIGVIHPVCGLLPGQVRLQHDFQCPESI